MKANPHSAAVFDKVKVSGLQTAIDGAWFYSCKGGRLLRCHALYFTTALLAPAARRSRAPQNRQDAMSLHRDFRSPSAHGAACQRTGSGPTGPSIQAARN